jgi:hypothetical protein
MTDVEVTCVNRKPGTNAHDCITHLAGPSWRWTRQQVLSSIEAGTNTFYTLEHGRRADVAIVSGANGPCLRARTSGRWTDDLLALPECRLHEGPVETARRSRPLPEPIA